jgi:hypothetical protein
MAQIRAMLRASIGLENLQIMLPMVSNVNEVNSAMRLIKKAHHELILENLEVNFPPIGIMIELPAAVYQTRTLAKLVDFISVGSNDLTQYLLAVDRNNPRVADLYSAFHPAVLNALYHVVSEAQKEKKPVSMRGEMAGDPGAAVLLMAMGFDILSMNAATLLKVKSVIRSVSLEAAFIDKISKPIAIKSTAAPGSPAISPRILTGFFSFCASDTTWYKAFRTAGWNALYRSATRGLFLSTASRYWVKSLLPTDMKSTNFARVRVWYTAAGNSIMMPIGGKFTSRFSKISS